MFCWTSLIRFFLTATLAGWKYAVSAVISPVCPKPFGYSPQGSIPRGLMHHTSMLFSGMSPPQAA